MTRQAAVTINIQAGACSLTPEEQVVRWVECAKSLAHIAKAPVLGMNEAGSGELQDQRRQEMADKYLPDFRQYQERAEVHLDPDDFHWLVMGAARYW